METLNDFDGVFRFTNPTDEDFTFLWNNKEYLFKSQTTSPMIIANESLENIQEIRKKAAYKLAVREFYKGGEFKRLNGVKTATPATYDEKVLEPMIEQCLSPLPQAKAKVREVPKVNLRTRGSKAVSGSANLNSEFAEENLS